MEPINNTAAATAATGSVATPASQTTPSAETGAPGSHPASTPQTAVTNRTDRRSLIADWIRNPVAAAGADSKQSSSPAQSNSGDGSPTEGGETGTSDDLSQTALPEGELPTAEGADPGREGDGADPEADPEAGGQPRKNNWPKEAVERVRKLKDQRQQLKTEIAQRDDAMKRLEAEVRELRSLVQKPAEAKAPVADLLARETEPAAIQQRVSEAQTVLDWADDLLDEVAADPDYVSEQLKSQGVQAPEGGWSEKGLRDTLRTLKGNARGVLQAAPKRLQFLQQEDHSLKWAMNVKPELADPDSEFAKQVQAVVAARPWIQEQPDWPILVTAALVGLSELQKRQAQPAPGAPAAAQRPVPRAPRAPGAPRSSIAQPPVSEVDAVRQRAVQKGASREDRRALVAAALRQTPTK